jgi:DnaJ family protein C protein 9
MYIAYRRKALLYHPDKGGDAELFKALAIVHSILSDDERRKIYDETGEVEADEDMSQDAKHWYDYFRTLFPKVTVSDIEKFGDTYIGSEEERNDIKNAYNDYDGSMPHMMEVVMLAEDAVRMCGIVDELIESSELKMTPTYKKFRSTLNPNAKPKRTKKSTVKSESQATSLESLIMGNRKSREDDLISGILGKYGGKKSSKMTDDIPDDEFEEIQRRMLKKENSLEGANAKTKKRKA